MIATITNVQLNIKETFGNGKTYDGHKVTYQPPPYQGRAKAPVEKFIFQNAEVAADVLKLKVGDTVDIQFETNGKFKNPISFKPTTSEKATGAAPWKEEGKVSSYGGGDKDDAIARAVAIKEASVVVSIIANGGGYTAKALKEREFIVEEVLSTARAFLPFLKNQESLDGVLTDNPDYDPDVQQDDYND